MNTDTNDMNDILLTRLLTGEPYNMNGVELLAARVGPHSILVKTYDDGSGPLWAYEESLGIVVLVRANTFDTAWDVVLDEILTPILEEDVPEAYGLLTVPGPDGEILVHDDYAWRSADGRRKFSTMESAREAVNAMMADRDLAEGYEYQPNATGTGIVQLDLNHNDLVRVTQEYLDAHEIELTLEEI